jgi:hypothetical protein
MDFALHSNFLKGVQLVGYQVFASRRRGILQGSDIHPARWDGRYTVIFHGVFALTIQGAKIVH